MEPRLSRRLKAAAEYITPGDYAADIGCDHGKLAAALILSGRCPRVIAADIRPDPLARAAMLFARLGIENRAAAVLSDGFENIDSAIDTAVIAGMGADSIAGIIGACEWIKTPEKRLVLAPASRHDKLRRYLYSGGFCIAGETAVSEYGHCYSVMLARYCGISAEISPGFAAVGLIGEDPRLGDGSAYLACALSRACRAAEGERMSDSPCKRRIAKLEQTIEYIRSRL